MKRFFSCLFVFIILLIFIPKEQEVSYAFDNDRSIILEDDIISVY